MKNADVIWLVFMFVVIIFSVYFYMAEKSNFSQAETVCLTINGMQYCQDVIMIVKDGKVNIFQDYSKMINM